MDWDPSSPREPVKVRDRELLSAGPEARSNEPVRDLKNELCSTKPETWPSEVLRASARPLVAAPERPIVSVKDLNSELCSAGLEFEPTDAVNIAVGRQSLEDT